MKNNKIKICGIKETSTIECCANLGVSYIGLLFYKKSPRFVSIDNAISLINFSKIKKIIPVGVFVNCKIEDIFYIIKKTNLDYIQLHGNEDFEYINKIKNEFNINIIKSIGIKEKKDLQKINDYSNVDYYLFDYKPEIGELPGGNAKSFNWSLLENIKFDKQWFISGGININNIQEIHKKIIPYGIDISSGVEAKLGIKSSKKIIELMEKLNEN